MVLNVLKIELIFPESPEHNITLNLQDLSLDENNHLDISDSQYGMKENVPYFLRVTLIVENDEVRELKYINNIKKYL